METEPTIRRGQADELPTRRDLREDRTGPEKGVPPGRGWSSWIGAVLLNLAALGGLICIVLVALAWMFDISLIMFKTGSMSPTIPAGSVAVVRQIPATEIGVGDIITVDRVGDLPVTHRVTGIVPGPADAQRIITMRGDANPVNDPFPYTVETIRSTLWHVPGLAKVVVWFGNPWIMGGITIAAAGLVTWSFWPRDRSDDPGHAS